MKIIRIILFAVILSIGFGLWYVFRMPAKFEKERIAREAIVIAHLRDIRVAQNAYLSKYGNYCGDIDSLVAFMAQDSVADGTPVRSMIRDGKLNDEDISKLKYIPFAGYQPLYLESGWVDLYGGERSPAFECRAPYKAFLSGLDHQELINVIDRAKNRGQYPGLMIGSMEKPLYDGGNWE